MRTGSGKYLQLATTRLTQSTTGENLATRSKPLLAISMTNLRSVLLLLASLILTASLSAHAKMLPDPEPETPVGTYDVGPMPPGTEVTLVIVPSAVSGLWVGYVFINGDLSREETMLIMRDDAGGYVWENSKVGPRTGKPGAGTIKWDQDHYDSEVTQGDNTGTKRTLTPM